MDYQRLRLKKMWERLDYEMEKATRRENEMVRADGPCRDALKVLFQADLVNVRSAWMDLQQVYFEMMRVYDP
jgi:hypothetical protein